jgi:hypothetical protein
MPRLSAVPWSVLFTLASAAVASPAPPRAVAYQIEAELLPAQGQIAVAARITVVRDDYLDPELPFLLHESFEIRELTVGDRQLEFTSRLESTDALRPASRRVVVALSEELRRPELVLEVAYGGRLAPLPQFGSDEAVELGQALDDTISPERVELAYYSSWYPQFGALGPLFSSDLAITVPEEWVTVATGERTEDTVDGGNRRTVWRATRASDLVVVASPELKRESITLAGASVEIFHSRLPRSYVSREAVNARRSLELFRDLLGDPRAGGDSVKVVYSPRAHGQGGYSRAPMVVLSEGRVLEALRLDPRLSLLRGTAHEAAHFWWNFGIGQGDWINEAFAEYFALLAVERIDSLDQLRAALGRARQVVERLPSDAPSLAEVPPSNQGHGTTIRYQKGALMLHSFRRALGDDAFLEACRAFYQSYRARAATTEDFRSFWSERLAEHAHRLDRWLDSPGGIPGGSG